MMLDILALTEEEVAALRGRIAVLEADAAAHAPLAPMVRPDAPAIQPGSGLLPVDNLDVYLQPVVDLGAGKTAAYRVSMMLRAEEGSNVAAYPVLARDGELMLAALDNHRLDRAEAVALRLSERSTTDFLIVRLNAVSLASDYAVQALLARREKARGLYDGIVFEITEASFMILTDGGSGISAGLRRLADAGASFCLAAGAGTVPAMSVLADQGIRFMIIPADHLVTGGAAAAADCAAAAASGIEVIACGVISAAQQRAIESQASLAYGPHFAVPRLVREPDAALPSAEAATATDAGTAEPSASAAA
jgi:EAL domain-containing protein (putative c-di-GMP-specific phosphodiesterase class I)